VGTAARKGGKEHEMPAHHLLEQYLDAYVTGAGIAADKAAPLFRTIGGSERQDHGDWRQKRKSPQKRIFMTARGNDSPRTRRSGSGYDETHQITC
jgi:hypothetical protein